MSGQNEMLSKAEEVADKVRYIEGSSLALFEVIGSEL